MYIYKWWKQRNKKTSKKHLQQDKSSLSKGADLGKSEEYEAVDQSQK